MAKWHTARELAGLPSMPSSERRTRDKLNKLGIPSRARQGREGGGGLEYDPAHLPVETRQALAADRIVQAGAKAVQAIAPVKHLELIAPEPAAQDQALVPAAVTRQPPSEAEQRCADARMQLLRMVDDQAMLHGLKKAYQMVAAQVTLADKGSDLQQLASAANQRRSTISARTLEAWAKLRKEGGWHGLLPAQVQAQPLAAVGDDVAAVLGLYFSKDPMFRNLTDVVRTVKKRLALPAEDGRALYDRCRRAIAKTDNVQAIKARHSGAQRAAMLPFKRRDTSVLQPNDVWLMDGHTYKAKVRHPDHGQPFAPELTLAVDAATRRIMGWSVSLSENVIAVGDALRHGISRGGVCAILYSDNGAGETALAMDCPIDGLCARLGIEHRTGIPGHPQGHGLIERSWRTHAIRSARQFGSYQGKDVDVGTFRKAAARIAKEQRAIARNDGNVISMDTKLVPTWEQFTQAIHEMVEDYNSTHRHRSLPKNQGGKHMSPNEAWAAMLQPGDQHMLTELELRTMFRPSILRTAKRGEVTFFNQFYAAPELMRRDVDGHQVSVRYDIHDPASVEVFTVSGEYVCQARWRANSMDYYPKPVVEMAREKRVQAAVKRREQQIDTALRELNSTLDAGANFYLPEPAAPVVLQPTLPSDAVATPRRRATKAQVIDVKADATPASGRPFFSTPSERYEWLMGNRSDWVDGDSQWITTYTQGDDYASLADYYASRGMQWDGEGEEPGNGFRGAQAAGGAGA